MVEAHRKAAGSPGQRFERRLVLENLRKWRLGIDADVVAPDRIAAAYPSADAGQMPRNVANIVRRRRDLEVRDRLENVV